MKTIRDSKGKAYKQYNNVCYHEDTPDSLIQVLDRLRQSKENVKVYYGDTKTGNVWPETLDVYGQIGNSTGNIKIPLLVHPRAYGGPGMLDHCILKVRSTTTGRVFYVHPNFKQPTVNITEGAGEYPYETHYNNHLHGRHKTLRSAQLCRAKLV